MSSPSRILRYHLFDFLGALFVETAFTLIQDRSQHRGQRSWIKVDYQREEQLHVVWQIYLLDRDRGYICFWWCLSAHLCNFFLGFGCSPEPRSWPEILNQSRLSTVGTTTCSLTDLPSCQGSGLHLLLMMSFGPPLQFLPGFWLQSWAKIVARDTESK